MSVRFQDIRNEPAKYFLQAFKYTLVKHSFVNGLAGILGGYLPLSFAQTIILGPLAGIALQYMKRKINKTRVPDEFKCCLISTTALCSMLGAQLVYRVNTIYLRPLLSATAGILAGACGGGVSLLLSTGVILDLQKPPEKKVD